MNQAISTVNKFYDQLLSSIRGSDGVFLKQDVSSVSYAKFRICLEKFISFLADQRRKKIVIVSEKSVDSYAAVVATLLTDNVWIPLSSDLGAERLDSIFSLLNPDLIIYDKASLKKAPSLSNCGNYHSFDMDDIANEPLSILKNFNVPNYHPSDVAIIYFTSGSTGVPKGVMISHENYITNVYNMLSLIEYGNSNIFADIHDISFVISVPVIFPCLMRGGAFAVPKDSIEAGYPADFLEQKKVTCLITVPSLIERLKLQRGSSSFECDIDCLIVCGEPCHIDTFEYVKSQIKPRKFYNFYGSTEVAPWVFFHDCDHKLDSNVSLTYVPIGRPIDPENMALDIDGELLIAGPQVSSGYLGEKRNRRFFKKNGKRWFRMGDIVEKRGQYFYCLGRKDNQVKVNGHRIDLLEIEGALQSLPEVDAAMCMIGQNKFSKYIIAVIFAESEPDKKQIIIDLSPKLPSYMVPRTIIYQKEKPLNKNGKLDRARIKELFS